MEEQITNSQLLSEVAEFLAGRPDREALLRFHPSEAAQQYARQLLDLSRDGRLSASQRCELDTCETIEILMRLIKAKAKMPKQ